MVPSQEGAGAVLVVGDAELVGVTVVVVGGCVVAVVDGLPEAAATAIKLAEIVLTVPSLAEITAVIL